MDCFKEGTELRIAIKQLVYEFMKRNGECSVFSRGMKQADIFRACGLDWGEYLNATSSNQQYWIVALLRELEQEGKIQRDPDTKRWRLK